MASLLSRSPTSLGNTLGVLYVGATIAAIFFGITNLQTLIYYKRYPNDWWIYRYSVALLWVLDALHVALSTHALYCLLIDWYGNVAAEREMMSGAELQGILPLLVPTIKQSNEISITPLQLAINVVIVVYVEGQYAIRLYKLGRHFHKILPWFVFLTVVTSLGGGIFMVYGIYVTANFTSITYTGVCDEFML
ncbi:uncharacterized protein ARMOST_18879 [Armillaria ostoyae]|uniref:Uncharacterized protein n=1 Tax=Armillaria ostoyae TaxID=47428 RepID=A0A284S2Z2_ARMOS|nr:uncharacterized protein ARMOST_18879 [Armillaria ostoyae]